MFTRIIVLATLATWLLITTTAIADEGGWVDRNGDPVPDSDSMKSDSGFGASLIVTPDEDWAEKWNTPRETTPYFSEASEVRVGQVLTILPLFINPKLDENRIARISCDLRIVRPDSSLAIDEERLNCFTYEIPGDPESVFLSAIIPKYVGEPGDPRGVWLVEMTMRDEVRGVGIPLSVSFELIE